VSERYNFCVVFICDYDMSVNNKMVHTEQKRVLLLL